MAKYTRFIKDDQWKLLDPLLPKQKRNLKGGRPVSIIETFERLGPTFDFSVMTINFQNSGTTECLLPRIKTSLRQIQQKPNYNLPRPEALYPDSGSRAHLTNYTGRASRILVPFFRLKANCLNIRSIWFFVIIF